jgi:hypothetical protein
MWCRAACAPDKALVYALQDGLAKTGIANDHQTAQDEECSYPCGLIA